jgi:hypothetical protein
MAILKCQSCRFNIIEMFRVEGCLKILQCRHIEYAHFRRVRTFSILEMHYLYIFPSKFRHHCARFEFESICHVLAIGG